MSLNNPGYFFNLKIIQPDFDKLYRKYEQMFADNQKKESGPVAIKVKGRLEEARIEDNITEGGGLLEADGIKKSSIRRNRTFLYSPKDNPPRIEKLEIIGRDKIEQHGKKNKASVENVRDSNKKWFSMGNPIVWLIFSTILIVIAFIIKSLLK